MRTPLTLVALGLSALSTACLGNIGDPSSKAGDPGPTGEDSSAQCAAIQPGNSPMRRMVRTEYDSTVHDLLGDTTHPAEGFLPEEVSLGFNNQAEALQVTQLLAQQYLEAAEALATTAVADLGALLPCDPAMVGDDICARQFIETFGKRAYRRPLAPTEIDAIFAVYQAGVGTKDFQNGIRLALEVILQSPHFLYRVEFGMPDPVEKDVVALSAYEIASRLSYLVWGSMPDDELFAAADEGKLATPEAIAEQARRMLEMPQARAAVARFHRQWLSLDSIDEVDKDTAIYPKYSDDLKPLWVAETEAFFDHVVFDGEGDLPTLLTAPYSMMNADLAAFYGVTGPKSADFEKVDLDPGERAGFLTHASLLALNAKTNQSSPIHRGKFVREMMLCQMMPDPPNDKEIVPPEIDPNATTREKFDQHSADPYCASCHHLMDPIGFGFEHYDGIGIWRDKDHGFPVDSKGELTGTVDVDGPFDGVPELAKQLAESAEVRQCVATQWFRYGYGRKEGDEDACSLQKVDEAFTAASFSIKELIVALTQTDAFMYRKAVKGGS